MLIIDKPSGLTSHDVVNRVRRLLHQPSVGHLGTLDPLATGVLPLVTGNLTRLAQFYLTSEKDYEGVIRFGFATDTYDSDGEAIGFLVVHPFRLQGLMPPATGPANRWSGLPLIAPCHKPDSRRLVSRIGSQRRQITNNGQKDPGTHQICHVFIPLSGAVCSGAVK